MNETIHIGLRSVTVSPDRRRAHVAGQPLSATDARELRIMLAKAIYNTWHIGSPVNAVHLAPASLDTAFLDRLADAAPHGTAPVVGVVERDDGLPATTVVRIDGVAVRVPTALVDRDRAAAGDAVVRIDAVRRVLYPGYLVVDGAHGRPAGADAILRLYVNVARPARAPDVLRRVLRHLADARQPYRAKICASRSAYPRRDALVVYLPPPAWRWATEVARDIGGVEGVGADVSRFAHQLAPGVALAWEPTDKRPGMAGLSFGLHRSMALATGLVAHAGSTDPTPKETAITSAFVDAMIDPAAPFRNLPARAT